MKRCISPFKDIRVLHDRIFTNLHNNTQLNILADSDGTITDHIHWILGNSFLIVYNNLKVNIARRQAKLGRLNKMFIRSNHWFVLV